MVFKVKATLGHCKDNGSDDDKKVIWEMTHDSCVGMHPGWEVPGMAAFREWCVPPDRCSVIDYEVGPISFNSYEKPPEPQPQTPQVQEVHLVYDGMGMPLLFGGGCPRGILMGTPMGFPIGIGGRVVIAHPGLGGFGFLG